MTPAMIVAVTIRADRYEPLQTAPELAGVQARVFDDLKPMPPAGYTEVITGPARRASAAGRRLTIEPALVERLLAETAEGADALPLLALDAGAALPRLRRRRRPDGGRVRVDGRDGPGGADRGRQPAGRRPRAAPSPARHPARCVHPVAGHHQPRQRPADAPPGPLGRPARRQPPADPGDGGQAAAGQRHPRRRRSWSRSRWKACCANGANWPPGCATKPRTSKTPTPWSAPPPTGRPAAATNPGCWKAPGWTEAETLAAKPGFRDRLDPTRDYLHASRDARKRPHRGRETTPASRTPSRPREQHAAAALRKRSRILIAVLAVTAVIAVVAVILGRAGQPRRTQADDAFPRGDQPAAGLRGPVHAGRYPVRRRRARAAADPGCAARLRRPPTTGALLDARDRDGRDTAQDHRRRPTR